MLKVGMYGGKFSILHNGHVSCIVQAASIVEHLYVVLTHSHVRDKELFNGSKIEYVPAYMRKRWLNQITKDMENVTVIDIEDDKGNEDYDWADGARLIKEAIGKPIDAVFSSEPSYSSIFSKLYPNANHMVIDSNRKRYPISATQLRKEGVYKNWDFLPNVVKPYFVKKIVVIGTESVGKSTLVRNLAKLYNTTYVEEFGRTVCEEIGGCDQMLDHEDFKRILYTHKHNEFEKTQTANKVVFIDSEATITNYYAHLYLGMDLNVADGIAKTQAYDFYLYLEPDVDWVDDGLRDYGDPATRNDLNQKLKQMLKENHIHYLSVNGDYLNRLNESMKIVDRLIE